MMPVLDLARAAMSAQISVVAITAGPVSESQVESQEWGQLIRCPQHEFEAAFDSMLSDSSDQIRMNRQGHVVIACDPSYAALVALVPLDEADTMTLHHLSRNASACSI